MKKQPVRVAFLNPNMPPRAVALLNTINENPKIYLCGIFYALKQRNRKWDIKSGDYEEIKFPYFVLNSISLGVGWHDYHNTFLSFDLFSTLKLVDPDIIVLPGWSDMSSLLALLWAKKNNRKTVLRTESTVRENSWRRVLFLPYIQWFLRQVDQVVGSSVAAEHFAHQHFSKVKSTTIYSSIDTEQFAQRVKSCQKSKAQVKKSLGLKKKYCVYFNGQLIKRKGIIELLEAFNSTELKDVDLLLSGYGPLEDQVKEAVGTQKNIHWVGFAHQEDLPQYYAIADVCILPSFEETWGVVVVEALASGKPIIVSQYVGASELINQERGIVIDEISATSIAEAIRLALKKDWKEEKIQKFALAELNYRSIAKQFGQLFQNMK